jgi:broad specificity phosphatase PhoE
MTLSLWIIRHGQSQGNRDRFFTGHGPSPLTELGRRQAEATACTLSAIPFTAIYCSDLPRALETALPLAKRTGLTLKQRQSLRERNLGEVTGLHFKEVAVRHPEVWDALAARDPAYRPPGGESHADCGLRIASFLQELFANHSSGRIVIVSHGIAINHLLHQFLGNPPGSVPHYSFRIDNCGVQRLDRTDEGVLHVLAINDTSHLAGVDELPSLPIEST